MADPRSVWRVINGERHRKCSSCETFKPATKQFFFFQGKDGCRGPHSWCKPCYATNSGRGHGMRKTPTAPAPPAPLVAVQAAFVAMRAVTSIALIGATLSDSYPVHP